MCRTRSTIDYENHLLNECRLYSAYNYVNSLIKFDFTDFSDYDDTLKKNPSPLLSVEFIYSEFSLERLISI